VLGSYPAALLIELTDTRRREVVDERVRDVADAASLSDDHGLHQRFVAVDPRWKLVS